jgi:Na+-translocating ferredoxin:NAD+ oxidoreductase RNF subunit RnfB
MADKIAFIREAECIGCIKCIKACSDNAILGARKQMHTIITDLCTGCEDCIAVCPVDCIEMVDNYHSALELCHPALVAGSGKMLDLNQTPQQVRGDNIIEHSSQNKKDLIADAVKRTLERRGWKHS